MNRFKIVRGKEKDFERIWRERDTFLEDVRGFKKFNLIKGNSENEFTIYASHSIWDTKDDFLNWTKLEMSTAFHSRITCQIRQKLSNLR